MVDTTVISAIKDLNDAQAKLDWVARKHAEAERRFVIAEHDYVVAKAKAYLRATGTVPEREAAVTLETDELRLETKKAEADVRIYRTDIQILRSDMEAVRSKIGLLRLEKELDR